MRKIHWENIHEKNIRKSILLLPEVEAFVAVLDVIIAEHADESRDLRLFSYFAPPKTDFMVS